MSNVKKPYPDAYIFQHEETGIVQEVDAQQVEWGFAKNNPRLKMVGSLYSEEKMESYATECVREALEQAAGICKELQCSPELIPEVKDNWLAIAEKRIRELLQKGI